MTQQTGIKIGIAAIVAVALGAAVAGGLVACFLPSQSADEFAPLMIQHATPKPDRPASWRGHCYKVIDGDTIWVAKGKQTYKVRIARIDAPEHDQPHGDEAREFVRNMIGDEDVEIEPLGKADAHGRLLADIGKPSCEGIRDIGSEEVVLGLAWHYREYDRLPQLDLMQEQAKAKKLGLWADPQPTPPWEWRKHKHDPAQPGTN